MRRTLEWAGVVHERRCAGGEVKEAMTSRSKQLPQAPRPSSREADGLQLASSWTRDGASLSEAARAGIRFVRFVPKQTF